MSDSLDVMLDSLQQKVNIYSDDTISPKISNVKGYLSKINIKATVIYGSIPVSIIFILVFWKPSFVLKEEDDSEMIDNSLSFKKMCIAVVVLSVMLDGLLFMYLRKKGITL